jgi:cysteine desulfurase family protein
MAVERPVIYFDHAATSLHKPACVVAAVCSALDSLGNSSRGAHDVSLLASRLVYQTRERISNLFNVGRPNQVVFTANATESLNIAIQGLVRPGDHVVSTVLEHNSVLRPLYLQAERGAQLSLVACDALGHVDPQAIEATIQPGTRAVICTHASNVTGNRVDIRVIGEICRRRGVLFIVDAAQTAGVFPIDLQADLIDVLCFSGHKALLGPQGTGCLCVRDGLAIPPLKVGGSGVQSFSRTHPVEMPTALEAGTQNGHGIAGLNAALEYLADYGIDRVRAEAQALMVQFVAGIRDLPSVKCYGDLDQPDRAPIVSLNLGDRDAADVSDRLDQEYGILTRPGAHCAPLMHQALGTVEQGAVRFSFSHFNTAAEVDAAIQAIRVLAGE